MITSKIAFCGAPGVGKHGLLSQLGQSKGAGPVEVVPFLETERMASLNLETPRGTTRVFGAVGPISDAKKTMRWMLEEAKAVVYVLGQGKLLVEKDQRDHFGLCVHIARSLGKTWDDVPWQFVLNRLDEGGSNPVLKDVPQRLRERLTRTSAKDNAGTEELLKRLHALV